MKKPSVSLALLFLFLLLAPRTDASLGVVLGPVAASVAAPVVVKILTMSGIQIVRIPIVHPKIMDAIKGTRIKLIVGVANSDIIRLAVGGTEAALEWLNTKVIPHVAKGQVIAITVGEDVLSFALKEIHYVVTAMKNLYEALKQVDLGFDIKISSPVSSSVLVTSIPPSAGRFSPASSRPFMEGMLKTLNETGSPLMMNVNPIDMVVKGAAGMAMRFFLMQENATMVDGDKTYTNILDATVDAAAAAMGKMGYTNIPVVVSSTGWPTMGRSPAANFKNSATYLEGVIRRAQRGSGTPMMPKMKMDVFVSNLFNVQGKGGHSEGVGIFNLDGSLAANANVASVATDNSKQTPVTSAAAADNSSIDATSPAPPPAPNQTPVTSAAADNSSVDATSQAPPTEKQAPMASESPSSNAASQTPPTGKQTSIASPPTITVDSIAVPPTTTTEEEMPEDFTTSTAPDTSAAPSPAPVAAVTSSSPSANDGAADNSSVDATSEAPPTEKQVPMASENPSSNAASQTPSTRKQTSIAIPPTSTVTSIAVPPTTTTGEKMPADFTTSTAPSANAAPSPAPVAAVTSSGPSANYGASKMVRPQRRHLWRRKHPQFPPAFTMFSNDDDAPTTPTEKQRPMAPSAA